MRPAVIAISIGLASLGFFFGYKANEVLERTQRRNAISRAGLIDDAELLFNGRTVKANLEYLIGNPTHFRRALLIREDRHDLDITHAFMLAAVAEHIRFNPYGDLMSSCDFVRFIKKHNDSKRIVDVLLRAQKAINGPLEDDYPHANSVAGSFVRRFINEGGV